MREHTPAAFVLKELPSANGNEKWMPGKLLGKATWQI